MQIHTAPDPYYLVSSFLPLSRGMALDSIILPHYNLYKPKLKLPQSDCQAAYGWQLHYDTRNCKGDLTPLLSSLVISHVNTDNTVFALSYRTSVDVLL